jgi:uncharacterized protein (DUF736 family)
LELNKKNINIVEEYRRKGPSAPKFRLINAEEKNEALGPEWTR